MFQVKSTLVCLTELCKKIDMNFKSYFIFKNCLPTTVGNSISSNYNWKGFKEKQLLSLLIYFFSWFENTSFTVSLLLPSNGALYSLYKPFHGQKGDKST